MNLSGSFSKNVLERFLWIPFKILQGTTSETVLRIHVKNSAEISPEVPSELSTNFVGSFKKIKILFTVSFGYFFSPPKIVWGNSSIKVSSGIYPESPTGIPPRGPAGFHTEIPSGFPSESGISSEENSNNFAMDFLRNLLKNISKEFLQKFLWKKEFFSGDLCIRLSMRSFRYSYRTLLKKIPWFLQEYLQRTL